MKAIQGTEILHKKNGNPLSFAYILTENGLVVSFDEKNKSFIGLAQSRPSISYSVFFPQPAELISFAITIFLTLIPAGFFQEIGKDLYLWIKKKTKKIDAGKRANIKVVLKGKINELSFLFEESFNDDTFQTAWENMTEFPIDALRLNDNKANLTYDQKSERWKIV